jgi:hypothetical protein
MLLVTSGENVSIGLFSPGTPVAPNRKSEHANEYLSQISVNTF